MKIPVKPSVQQQRRIYRLIWRKDPESRGDLQLRLSPLRSDILQIVRLSKKIQLRLAIWVFNIARYRVCAKN